MKQSCRRAWLITNFSPSQIITDYKSILPTDLIIAVDAGYKRCLELNLVPDVLLGDFDSLEPELLAQVSANCKKLTFPGMKNETDTQLAIEYCIEQGIEEIFICNDLSGRFDHALALVQNLQQAKQHNVKAYIYSETQILTLLNIENHFTYPVDSILSLISLSEISVIKSSTGLQYSLDDLTLYNWQARGISNVTSAAEQTIVVESGTILSIITVVI
jgi:thiamine pyrophosphokinase